MSFRNRLKKTKAPELSSEDAFEVCPLPQWSVGTDCPLSWDKKGLRRCEKNGLRVNYKNGFFTKAQYRQALKGMKHDT